MYSFKLNEKVYEFPENWSEVSMRKYIEIAKLEQIKNDLGIDELYTVKLIELLCNAEEYELDDMDFGLLNILIEKLRFVYEDPKMDKLDCIEFNGINYVYPVDMNALKLGEYISIKTYLEKGQFEGLPYVIAILLRPGKKVYNAEKGCDEWIQEKFDVKNLEWRKELFMDLTVDKFLNVISFFLIGKN